VGKIERTKTEKAPVILDFGDDAVEAVRKLESILYTSGWNNYIIVDPDTPSEDALLFSLIWEKAIVVAEVYYTYTTDFTEELKNKAHDYFHRLRKRNIDNIYLNAVNFFSKHEPDVDKTDNGALFYSAINAYVRCGDLSPSKLLELLKKDDCDRIFVFGSTLWLDKDQPRQIFHSFEMRAPKKYILQRLDELQEERHKRYCEIMETTEINDVFPSVSIGEPDE
jgi:hypothetical protein